MNGIFCFGRRVAIAGVLIAQLAASPLLFDMGTETSDVWEGFTRVTAKTVWSGESEFGWKSPQGLSSRVMAYKEPVSNPRRGASEPPPIWTNAITEDAVIGSSENSFLFRAAPGEYELYVVCGTSDPALRSQFFDFTVRVGAQQQRVQIEGAYQFRTLRFKATVGAGAEPLVVMFSPRSKWVVNALIAWTSADAVTVRRDVIDPFEQWTFRMAPQEWAKWQRDPVREEPMPIVSDADKQRGFLVYARHYLECVYPETRPRAEELNPELRLFATPGESGTANFVVLPLAQLRDAKVNVSAVGPIPAENIDVRHVRFMRARPNYTVQYRYRVVPDLLEHFESLDLPANENARFWITLRIPEKAPAGNYTGKIVFVCTGGSVTLPLRVRVLPITLREDPSKIFGIYYRHPYDQMASAPDEVSKEHFRRKAELEHQDMVAHGTRNVVLSVSGRPADAQGNFNFNWDLLEAKFALWRKHGFVGPAVMGFPVESVYEKYMKARTGSHLRGVEDPPDEFGREITAMVRTIEAERQRRGWPEFLYYPVDEPATDAAAVNFMVKVLSACKAAGVRTYVTADPTHEQFDPMRPLIDVWSTQPFAPDRETVIADMKARPVEYWCYPNHVNGENDHTPVTGARMTYGFGFWRSGFRALIPWIYQSSTGDPFNYLDGASMDFFNRSEPDGTPIPVAMWEAYREGYNDYRYLYTLEQRIAEAKTSSSAAVRSAAANAERELQSVWNAIRVQPKYKHDDLWSPPDFDAYRWILAQQIMAIDEASRR
jgi:hypothetical protein